MLNKFFNYIMRRFHSEKSSWKQGDFKPKFPEKCLNVSMNKPIRYRSSWEERFFNYCDSNANVLKWGSEVIQIPYIYEVDKKRHIYYPDVYCEIKNKEGNIVKYLIEIKPEKQLKMPTPPKTRTRKALQNYKYGVDQFIRNKNKWKFAKMFCETRDFQFKVITENNLF